MPIDSPSLICVANLSINSTISAGSRMWSRNSSSFFGLRVGFATAADATWPIDDLQCTLIHIQAHRCQGRFPMRSILAVAVLLAVAACGGSDCDPCPGGLLR